MKKVIIAFMMFFASCSNAEDVTVDSSEDRAVSLQSKFVDGKYQNIKDIQMMPGSGYDMMKEWFFSKTIREPEIEIIPYSVDGDTLFKSDSLILKVTWLGHSSFIVEHDSLKILLDPVLSNDISPVSFLYSVKRFQKNVPITADSLPHIDVVVISHDHYDHLDKKTIKALASKVDQFIVPKGVDKHLLDWGIDASKIAVLDWMESFEYKNHLFTSVPAQHFSGRGMFDRSSTLWTSWVVQGPKHKFFYSGDTGYHEQFKTIGEKFGPFDITIIETGQYGKYWPDVHMFPEQSVQAHIDLRGDLYIPAHWGSFNLSSHNWFDPIETATAEAKKRGVKIATPTIGSSVVFGEEFPTERWWERFKISNK